MMTRRSLLAGIGASVVPFKLEDMLAPDGGAAIVPSARATGTLTIWSDGDLCIALPASEKEPKFPTWREYLRCMHGFDLDSSPADYERAEWE
jgi:hypothetical protein